MSAVNARSRRSFLVAAARAGLGASLPLGSLLGLAGCRARSSAKAVAGRYGELVPARDETTGEYLLKLPAGFRYRSSGWVGSALADGGITPPAHDGMGVVAASGTRLTLVRNHEVVAENGAIGAASLHYDAAASGGCVAFDFDAASGEASGHRVVLGGTMQNCAGGTTPWGTWLSCEEMVFDPALGLDDAGNRRSRLREPHGFVFECDPSGSVPPRRIPGMGAFKHEAAAVHAASGDVFLTEDFKGHSGFYRYVPDTPGLLAAGGRLQMLACRERSDFRRGLRVGQSFRTHWVDIAEPTRLVHGNGRVGGGVYEQGERAGGAVFTRLEGCFAEGDAVFFTSTDGGDFEHGQVFVFHPRENRLVLLYETSSLQALDYPDNLCVSPHGGLLICEDNGNDAPQRLIAMTLDGEVYPLVENTVRRPDASGRLRDYSRDEWCGVCFSPDGQWLFANVYNPGFTVAITGPWQREV
jgi:secreted PhoX family phosphatase